MSRLKIAMTTVASLIVFAFSFVPNVAEADDALLEGVRPFLCDKEILVFFQTDTEWAIAASPETTVVKTSNGWQLDNQDREFVAYLKREESGDWVLEILSSSGYERQSCNDVEASVSEVVTLIKPRLNAAISDIQNDLADATDALAVFDQEHNRLIHDNDQLGEEVYDLRTALEASLTARDILSKEVQALTESGEEASLEVTALQSRVAALMTEAEVIQSDNDFQASLLASLNVDEKNEVRIATTLELGRHRTLFFDLLRGGLEGTDGAQIERDSLVFSNELLFSPGSADLSRAGRVEIAKVADILLDIAREIPSSIKWMIRVDGHTDNVPLSGLGQFANNWELSQARALTVVLYMVHDLGVPPNRLTANGFGQHQPLNDANSDEARAQNRRIELKFVEQ